MKKIFLVWWAVFLYTLGQSQMYDAQWVLGPLPSTIDFGNNTITNHWISDFFSFTFTDANICDSSGNLLLITNGINLYDKNGDSLTNGNGLSPCPYSDIYASDGLNIAQAALFIPAPGKPNLYYLLHMSEDTLNGGRPGTLYYTLIDGSGGYGTVLQKNVAFSKGIFTDGGITGCKHANGRDYWIIKGCHNSNTYFKFLFTPDTILGPFIQSIGPNYSNPNDNSCSKFSQDGSKFVTGAIEGLVAVMDFDRCTGELSNSLTMYNEAATDPIHNTATGCVSVELSPNGRFVYVSDRLNLNQYDLWSSNIQDSVEIYRADSGDHAQIDMIQLAPNGKIYGSTWNGGFKFLHVINQPNEKGDSCGFVFGGQATLSINSANLPNMINYKLGPLIGSGCDTLNTGIGQAILDERIRVIPNPADKYVYVEIGKQGDYEMRLLNEVGQLIATRRTRQIDVLNTANLVSGIYFLQILDKLNNTIHAQKIIVQH